MSDKGTSGREEMDNVFNLTQPQPDRFSRIVVLFCHPCISNKHLLSFKPTNYKLTLTFVFKKPECPLLHPRLRNTTGYADNRYSRRHRLR